MFNQTAEEATHPPLHPWHRQPGETPRQFEAFELYLDGLTQVAVANKLYKRGESESKPLYKKPPGQITKWASKNDWTRRRLAHSDHLNLVREEAVECEQKSQAVDWARRRAELDEQQMRLAEELVAKVLEMLPFPLTRDAGTTVEWHDEEKKYPKTVHVFEPARWTFNTAGSMLMVAKEAAEEVFRRQMGQPGEHGDASGQVERRLLEMIEQADEEQNGNSGS